MVKMAATILLLFFGHSITVLASEQSSLLATGKGSVSTVIPIDKAGETVQHRDINIQYNISTRTVLSGQMLAIHYRLQSNDAFITLRSTIEPGIGESYIELLPRKTKLTGNNAKRYQYELNVLFNTSRSGTIDLRVPDLIYSEGGKDKYRFNFTSQAVQVKALPPYLPPYIPMTPLRIESDFSTKGSWFNPLETHRIYYWTIELQTEKADMLSLPDLRQQLISNASIEFLPAEISRNTEKRHNTMIQNVTYNIPFMFKKSGLAVFPEIGLRYFDPESRRLSSRQYRVEDIVVLNLYLQWLIVVILFSLVCLGLWKIRFFILNVVRNGRHHYQAKQMLANADSALKCRLALNHLGASWGWPDNLSLSQWTLCWQQNINHTNKVGQSIDSLRRSLYSPDKNPDSINQVRNALESSYLRQWFLCIKAAQ